MDTESAEKIMRLADDYARRMLHVENEGMQPVENGDEDFKRAIAERDLARVKIEHALGLADESDVDFYAQNVEHKMYLMSKREVVEFYRKQVYEKMDND